MMLNRILAGLLLCGASSILRADPLTPTQQAFADAQALHGGHPPWRLED